MAALTHTTPFQNALKTCSRRSAGCQRRALVCRAEVGEPGWQKNLGVQLLAAGLAATALVAIPSTADAKVILEQPKVKKVFQTKPKSPEAETTESSGGGGGGLQLPSVSFPSISGPNLTGLNFTPSDSLDPRSVALPGAILGIGGAGFAAFQLDTGFREMLREGLVKDSNNYAGYEEEVRGYATQGAANLSKGTKKIAKAASKVKGKAKGGLFGRKK